MATSGTSVFTLTVDEIITEAMSRIGGEDISGAETRQAKVKLNLMMLDLLSAGINLWTVERITLPLVRGTNRYVLPADTLDVLEMVSQRPSSQNRATASLTNAFSTLVSTPTVTVAAAAHGAQPGDTMVLGSSVGVGGLTLSGTYSIVTVPSPDSYTITAASNATSSATSVGTVTVRYPGTIDLMMTRIPRDEYFGLPNKGAMGLPVQFYLDRQIQPVVYLYLTPDGTVPTIAYKRQRKLQDIASLTNTLDIPTFVLPAIISGLAWRMSQMRPQLTPELRGELKQEFDEYMSRALQEDRDSSPLEMQPDFSSYYGR